MNSNGLLTRLGACLTTRGLSLIVAEETYMAHGTPIPQPLMPGFDDHIENHHAPPQPSFFPLLIMNRYTIPFLCT
jgi:hypothetical protein